MNLGLSFGSFGTNDFIEYWSAFQLFIAQSNPYDPAALFQIQQTLGWSDTTPLMMWNPPWLLLLLSPILSLSFHYASLIWLILSVGLAIWIVYFALDLLSPDRVTGRWMLWGCLVAATFFPMWSSLRVGQLGVLLAWGFCGALWAIERKKPLMVGFCLSLWTLKIHLFLPIAVYLIFRSLRDRFLWRCFGYSLAFVLLFVGATEWLHPGAVTQWLGAFEGARDFNRLPHIQDTASQVVLVEQWIAASLTGAVRMFLAEDGLTPSWPMWVVPLIGISLAGLMAIITPRDSSYIKGVAFSSLLAVSFAPFGWVFDFSILLTSYLLTLFGFDWVHGNKQVESKESYVDSNYLREFKSSRATQLASIFLIVQVLAWSLSSSFNEHQHYLWLPLVMLGGVTWRRLFAHSVQKV